MAVSIRTTMPKRKPTKKDLPPPSLNDAVHSIEDAALLLKIGRNSVYNLIGCKKLRVAKIGRRTLITNVAEYLATLKAA